MNGAHMWTKVTDLYYFLTLLRIIICPKLTERSRSSVLIFPRQGDGRPIPGRGKGRRQRNYLLSSVGQKAYSYDVALAWCIKTFRRIGLTDRGSETWLVNTMKKTTRCLTSIKHPWKSSWNRHTGSSYIRRFMKKVQHDHHCCRG